MLQKLLHRYGNKLSGSTGIAGAVDAIYVLEKNERTENGATLYASGRDIRNRKMKLEMESTTCTWQLMSDSLVTPETSLPDELAALVDFVKKGGVSKDATSNWLKPYLQSYVGRLQQTG